MSIPLADTELGSIASRTTDSTVGQPERGTIESLVSSYVRLRDGMAMIGRMHLFPDDGVNRTTLLAAIKIAHALPPPPITGSERP